MGNSSSNLTLGDTSIWCDYIFLDNAERKRFATLPHEYLIEQLQYTGEESLTGTNHSVKLQFNHPCKELLWVFQDEAGSVGLNANRNFTIGGSTVPMTSAKLLLNGNERFKERDADYFKVVQPYEHHTTASISRHIHLYSFALKPEELQPSGTLNFSRIDNANLQFTTNTSGGGLTLYVFAINYNILRIGSGMGGLTSSN